MNNKLKYLSLLILPVLLFYSASLLKISQGPYYLNIEDPSYVYLINSLNVSLRFPVGHFDHPGTTVQIIGAAVIRLYHWINSSSPDLIRDVLSMPEEYLSFINMIFILIGSLVLFFLGLLTFKLSGNILYSLLIQLSPFVSLQIFYGLKIVASDNILISISLCFTGILIYYLFRIKADAKSHLPFIIAFALICALGLATKISFFPMLLIPLILLRGTRSKLLFLLFVLVSFFVFVFPAISNYDKFIEWVWMLILFNGSYGHGDPSFVDIPKFFTSLRSIFWEDPVFTVTYFLSVFTLVTSYYMSKKEKQLTEKQFKEFKLLLSITLAMTIQIVIVSKQYRQHYMIPSFILSLFTLSLCIILLSSFFKTLESQKIYASIIIVVSVISFNMIFASYKINLKLREEAFKVNRYAKEHSSNALLISSFCSANKEFSLAFGVSYSGKKIKLYKSILSTLQRENIFYITWLDEFFSLGTKENVLKSLRENKRIIFQTNQDNINEFIQTLKITYGINNVSKKILYSNLINENVYEITTGSTGEE